MRCDEIAPRLPDYALDNLSHDAATAIGEHIEVCDECRRELARLGQVAMLVERVPLEEPPPGLWSGIAERLPSAPPRPIPFLWRLTVGAATVAAMIVLVFFAWVRGPAEPSALAQVPAAYRAYAQQYFLAESEAPLADHFGSGYLMMTSGPDTAAQ